MTKTNNEYTGGKTNYYQVPIDHPVDETLLPYTAECQDIIDALGMTFNEGNCFKALWRRCAARTLGKSKRGYTDGLYDAEKVVFYGERLVQLEQLQRKEGGVEQLELGVPGLACLSPGCENDAVGGAGFCPLHQQQRNVAIEALRPKNQRNVPRAPVLEEPTPCCTLYPECIHNIGL